MKRTVPDSFVPLDTKFLKSLTAFGPKSGMECIGGNMMARASSSQVADLDLIIRANSHHVSPEMTYSSDARTDVCSNFMGDIENVESAGHLMSASELLLMYLTSGKAKPTARM